MGLPTLEKARAKVKVNRPARSPRPGIILSSESGLRHDEHAYSTWSLLPSAGHTEAVPDSHLTNLIILLPGGSSRSVAGDGSSPLQPTESLQPPQCLGTPSRRKGPRTHLCSLFHAIFADS